MGKPQLCFIILFFYKGRKIMKKLTVAATLALSAVVLAGCAKQNVPEPLSIEIGEKESTVVTSEILPDVTPVNSEEPSADQPSDGENAVYKTFEIAWENAGEDESLTVFVDMAGVAMDADGADGESSTHCAVDDDGNMLYEMKSTSGHCTVTIYEAVRKDGTIVHPYSIHLEVGHIVGEEYNADLEVIRNATVNGEKVTDDMMVRGGTGAWYALVVDEQ